ncbi:DUF4232 domain-containing protein [Actinoplanes sp. NPDC026619]|uniref:DUF4232 domain-containing protein n=1 Tax=Actinoplanes sp. NPDC026619 TaxID=3155798 RepID=UPI0033C31961
MSASVPPPAPAPVSASAAPSVPAPAPAQPACPAGGVRVELGPGDAAMGLRVLDLYLVNCGTATYRVNGYPVVRLLDDQRQPVTVQVLKGTTAITGSIPDYDKPPSKLTLRPGQRATAVLAWRNTYNDITNPPVSAPYLEIGPAAGAPAQPVTPRSDIDLGSTGRVAVSAWRPAA